MGFAENYLKLRDQREDGQTGTAEASARPPWAGQSPATAKRASGPSTDGGVAESAGSFAENYLKLRKQRMDSVPNSATATSSGRAELNRAQALDASVARSVGGPGKTRPEPSPPRRSGVFGGGTIKASDQSFTGQRQSGGPTAGDWASLARNTALAGVGQVSKAAASLFSGAEQLVTRPMGWALGNPELYKDFPLYRLNQGADRNTEILASRLAQSAKETGKAGELIARFGPATIAALPQAGLAYLTAGQSMAAQASTAGLQAASTAAQLSGGAATANAVLNAAKSMAANPSFQYSFLNTAGGEYEQALADGTDAPTAYAYAALSSLANAAVEVGGGVEALPGAIRGKNKNMLLEWVRSMFDEGKEEVVQGAISQLMQKGVYGKDNPLYSPTDENAVINPGRIATDFAGGAVVGGILGGGQMALQNAVNKAAARSFQDEVMAQLTGEADVQPDTAPSGRETRQEGLGRAGEVSKYSQAQTGPETAENGQAVRSAAAQETSLPPSSPREASAAQGTGQPGFQTEDPSIANRDRNLLDSLGKITGANIQVVSSEELARITGREGANGVQMGNQIYLSEAADRPLMEVAKHELTHRLQDTAPEAYSVFRDYVAGVYRESGTLESYIDGLRRSREGAGLQFTEEQALDEIAADYAGSLMVDENAVRRLAGEDRGLLERMLDGLRDFIRKIRNALGGNRSGSDVGIRELEQAAQLWQNALEEAGRAVQTGEADREAGETRYSIGYDQDNRPFVTVEEDILEGVPREDWVRTVKDNLRKKFPNGVTVGNSEIEIDGTSRREMTWSGYSQWLRKTKPEVFADKLRATNNTDEILQAARDYVNEGLHHPRSDSIQDFARGVVQLRVGENDYTADVVVGLRSNGTMLLYDLLNLSPAEIQERSQGRQTATPSPGSSRSTATDSSFSISQPDQDVKPLRLPTLEEEDVSDSDTAAAMPEGLRLPSPEDGIVSGVRTSLPPSVSRDVIAASGVNDRPVSGAAADYDRPSGASAAQDTSENTPLSMAGDADLKKEIERLKRQNERLKEQTKRTDSPRRNRDAVARQAKDLLRTYSSQLDAGRLTERLQSLWDHQAAKHGTLWERDKAPSWNEIKAEARGLAEDILESSEGQVNELFDDYRELRKELRTTKVSIAPEYWADLESAGGYNGLRKQYFGRFRLGNNGPGVDQVYAELASWYPELFPDDIVHPADQLLRITDVIDELEPAVGNPYEAEMDRAVEFLAGDLIERFYDTPQKTPTFADRQAQKLAEQRKKDREEFQARLYRQRRETDQRIKRIQEKNKEATRKRIENQNAAQRRETIRRHADRLGRMLLRPTDKRHIPEALRGAALELVRQIDTGSNYLLDPDTGKRVYSRDEYQTRIEGAEGLEYIQTRRTQAARELQAQYRTLAEKGGFTIDPDMEGYLDELAGMGETQLGDMTKGQLDTVWKVMRVVEHCITKSNELLGQSRYATVSEMAEHIREQNGKKKDRKNLTGLAGTVDQLLNMDMLTPETYFHKLGEAGEAVFQQMRSAADQQTTVLKEGVERAQELVAESKMDLRKAEKELHTFSTSGGELTLSTAQIMELYVLSKREQALEHIYIGGLKPQGAQKGRAEAGRAAPVKVTPSDVAVILETLTPEQKNLADGLQAYLSGDLAKHGNDASMTVYGYEKFKEDNYWPIKVDRNQTRSDVKKEAESKTVAGYGMTQAVKPHAANAVVLRGILDSYTDHLNQMATYSGWLATSEDVNRLHNFKFADEDGNADGTMKTLLEQVYGRNGNRYLDNLMSDIALGTKAGAEPSFSDRGLNQFKAAKVGGNLRVILQQPTAILRAASMVDPKYFLVAKNPMKGWETAKKYAPIAQWKDWGYFELDTGRSLKELIAGESNKLETVKNKLMEPAGMADSVAWGHLWNAVEAETAEKQPDLRQGSEGFYQAAAERFGEIIDRTQVVDSVLHRTQIMRSSNSMTRMATSFMSEPSKIYNMVVRDIYDIQAADSAAKRAKAGKALARSAISLIASFAVNAVAQSLPDMWRDKDRDKTLEEKFTDAYMGNFLENFDPVGYVPFLKDFESIVQGYSVDRSDLEGFSDVVNALGQMHKAWTGDGKQSRAAAALELACKGGDMLGLPMTNVKRDIAGIVQAVLQGTGDVEAQYALDKLGLNPDKASATFYGDLYRAMGTDWEQYENIYKDISENWEQYGGGEKNWDEEKFQEKTKNAMERQMAKDMGLERVSSLPIEYSPPGANRTFDQEVRRQLEKDGTWMDTLPEGTLEQARELDALEPEEGKDSVTKLQKIRELRDSVWGNDVKDLFLSKILTETEYERLQGTRKAGISIEKWCKLYEDISQEKVWRTGKTGSPSQEDVSAALERSGLTEKQKDAVWDSYGWKGERMDVSKSDTTPEGSLQLPEPSDDTQLPRLTPPGLR